MPKIFEKLKKASPTIVSCLAAGGSIVTVITAVRATPKAIKLIEEDSTKKHGDPKKYTKKEAVQSAWKCYVPSFFIGIGTITCIFGANSLNRRAQASVTSAYLLVNESYQRYKNKVKEKCGEDIHNQIIDEIAAEKAQKVNLYAPGITGSISVDFDEDDPDNTRLFYDSFSNRYFESTIPRVMEAEYHLNRNWVLGAGIAINDFYEFLGIDPIPQGDELSWYPEDGLGWIDFNHRKAILDDGLEVYIIDTVFAPRLPLETD